MHQDRIAIIAPAGAPEHDAYSQGIRYLTNLNFTLHQRLQVEHAFRYFSAPPAMRAEDLLWALTSPDIDTIWMARGGYGCIYLLDALPKKLIYPKTIIGYSDITALMIALSQHPSHRQLRLIHGPMINGLANKIDEDSREHLWCLYQKQAIKSQSLKQLCGPQLDTISAPLTGGNLTVLASLCGTPWQLNPKNHILILEDVGEYAYRLDRHLMQLKCSGVLQQCVAIILGEFSQCYVAPQSEYQLNDIFRSILQPLNIPVYWGLACGHGKTNLAWEYHQKVHIQHNRLVW